MTSRYISATITATTTPGEHMKAALLAIAAVIGLAACSSAAATKEPSTSAAAASSSAAPKFVTDYGQDAALIASHDTACAGVQAGGIGNGASTGLVATATCTLLGHSVFFTTWKDAESQAGVIEIYQVEGKEAYFADGIGWSAEVNEDGATLDAQQAVAKQIAGALDGTVEHPRP